MNFNVMPFRRYTYILINWYDVYSKLGMTIDI